jgi:hypothetical protein
MGIESHALDRVDKSEHALVADTGTFDLAAFGLPVGGDLELMKALSMEVGRAYCHSVSVRPSRSAGFATPSAGVELPVRLSNYALQATPTNAEAGRFAVTPAALIRFAGSTAGYAAVAPALARLHAGYGVPELDR